ncbi:MAG: class I SAM-dependent methyltransferase [Myxococcales bacterium FL481]|nr:MAG: class I SAM-dependent methyltransferase [Myxococcales bacterium FL481]
MSPDTRFWNRLAERYAAKPIANPKAYERKLALTRAELSPEQTLLDVGCGTGSLALELAGSVAHVHALDVSEEMLRIAEHKQQAQGVTNVTWHVRPLDRNLPFDEGSFGCVCAFNILHLVDDRQGVLQALYRLLAPGGRFVSSTPCLGDSRLPLGAMIAVMRWFGKAPHVWRFNREELLREFADAGFVDARTADVGAKATTAFVIARKPS